MTNKRMAIGLMGLALLLAAAPASAQLAPPPKKAPRTPVSQENLPGSKAKNLPSRILAGPALILDAERLKVADVELRLFGVVPPQMGASFGPQARAVVDSLAQGDVTCQVKDRNREGHYLASCRNAANADFGLELLRRGLALTARGSLTGSDLASAYMAAEQAAQSQRLGLWSIAAPAGATESAIREAAAKAEAAKQEAAKAMEEAKAEIAKAEEMKAMAEIAKQQAAKAENSAVAMPASALTLEIPAGGAKSPPLPQIKPESKPLEIGPTAAEVQALLQAPAPPPAAVEAAEAADPRGFWERYQLMVVGLLFFGTALVGAATYWLNRTRERREELRSIAAALRGELMAARSICLARLARIAQEGDDRSVTWPRLRTLVFQAYVGRLGHLGAELSRQIASIYGQASDYASYFAGPEGRSEAASKRHSLQALVHHIEEVAPRLSHIEREGNLSAAAPTSPVWAALWGRMADKAKLLSKASSPPPSGGPGTSAPLPPAAEETISIATSRPQRPVSLKDAKDEIVASAAAEETDSKIEEAQRAETTPELREEAPSTSDPVIASKEPQLEEAEAPAAQTIGEAQTQSQPEKEAKTQEPSPAPVDADEKFIDVVKAEEVDVQDKTARDEATADPVTRPEATAHAATSEPERRKEAEKASETFRAAARADKAPAAAEAKVKETPAKKEKLSAREAMSKINFSAPIFEKLAKIKTLASEQMARLRPRPMDDLIPDYANLTEEELEALAYAEEYFYEPPAEKKRKTG